MYEQGWDSKIIRILTTLDNIGVAGFFGAKSLGAPDVYKTPYKLSQLGRGHNISGCYRMSKEHGYRMVRGEYEYVAVLDGFSLIISRKFLDENNGFDLNLPPHHMYDNHTCLQSINLGYKNIVISMDAFHHGGMTDCSEDWNVPFNKSKLKIHEEAHYPYFYNYWHPNNVKNGKNQICLPYHVE